MQKNVCTVFLALTILTACTSTSTLSNADVSAGDLLNPDVDTLLVLAKQAEEEDRLASAINHYENALSQDDTLDTARSRLAKLYCLTGNYSACKKTYQLIIEAHPNNISAAEGLAIVALKLGDIESAKKQFLQILAIDSDSYPSLNYLGVISDLEGNYEQSAKYYDLALLLKPDDPSILNNLGYSCLMSGKYQRAQSLFEKALSLMPDKPQRIKNNLSISYARQGLYNKAVELISPTMDDPVVFNNVGYIAMLNGDYKLAIQYFEKAITLSPSYYERADFNKKRTQQMLTKQQSSNKING